MVTAVSTFLSSVKARTIPSVLYTVVLIISGILLVIISLSPSEQFSCLGTKEKYFETSCLKLYNRGPNHLQNWLYLVYFFVPFSIFVIGGLAIGIKLYWIKNKGTCALHLHHYFFGTVVLCGAFHLSLGLYLSYVWVSYNNRMRMDGNFLCLFRNSTISCTDGRADSKSTMSIACMSLNWVLFAFNLLELVCYLPKWIAVEKENRKNANDSNGCWKCALFTRTFLALLGESEQITDGSQTEFASDNERGEADTIGLLEGNTSNSSSTGANTRNGYNTFPTDTQPSSSLQSDGGRQDGYNTFPTDTQPLSSSQVDGGRQAQCDIRDLMNDLDILMKIADLLEQGNGNCLQDLALMFDVRELSELESVVPVRRFFEHLVSNTGDIRLLDLKKLIEENLRFHNMNVFLSVREDIEKGNVKFTLESTLAELFGNGIHKLYFLENIAYRLLKNSFRLPSWEDIADHYGYDDNDIQGFKANVEEERRTVKLFRYLSCRENVPTIATLKGHLKALKRFDIIRILNERF